MNATTRNPRAKKSPKPCTECARLELALRLKEIEVECLRNMIPPERLEAFDKEFKRPFEATPDDNAK